MSEQYGCVVGVDTHAAAYTFAAAARTTGAVLDDAVSPRSRAGLERVQTRLARRGGDTSALVVVEGTQILWGDRHRAADGRGALSRPRVPRGNRRGQGTSGVRNAVPIARSVTGLTLMELRCANCGG